MNIQFLQLYQREYTRFEIDVQDPRLFQQLQLSINHDIEVAEKCCSPLITYGVLKKRNGMRGKHHWKSWHLWRSYLDWQWVKLYILWTVARSQCCVWSTIFDSTLEYEVVRHRRFRYRNKCLNLRKIRCPRFQVVEHLECCTVHPLLKTHDVYVR